jgi:hypothetical protein
MSIQEILRNADARAIFDELFGTLFRQSSFASSTLNAPRISAMVLVIIFTKPIPIATFTIIRTFVSFWSLVSVTIPAHCAFGRSASAAFVTRFVGAKFVVVEFAETMAWP